MKITFYERLPGDVKGKVLGTKEFQPPFRTKQDPTGGQDRQTFKQVAEYARSLSPKGALVERDEEVEAAELAAFKKELKKAEGA